MFQRRVVPTLFPAQEKHVQEEMEILMRNPFVFDFSQMGAGKSFTTSAIALRFKYPNVIVVCPVIMIDKWASVLRKFGVDPYVKCIVSYESLRSVKGTKSSHGLLATTDDGFRTTSWFDAMVKEGCFLIVDEIQKAKNQSLQRLALATLINHIFHSKSRSRIALLSGTPFDKEEQVVSFMSTIGIMKLKELCYYDKSSKNHIPTGFNEVVRYCSKINREKTERVMKNEPRNKGDMQKACFDLFNNVIKPATCVQMPFTSEVKPKNGYFSLDSKEEEALESAINKLSRAVGWSASKKTLGQFDHITSGVNLHLLGIEAAKVPIYIRKAHEFLKNHRDRKVAILMNYTDSLFAVSRALQEYNPLVMNGSTKQKDRIKMIEKYQNPDSGYRLILANMGVIQTGIDLDDKTGDRPRIVLATPSYSPMVMHQAAHRFWRRDSRSIPEIFWVYGKCGKTETSILNALSRKSQVMKNVRLIQENEIIYPGDYPSFKEGEADEEKE